MAYLQHTSWKDRPGQVAGVVAVHALVGYALVTGLSFTGFAPEADKLGSYFVPDVELPPPPPPDPEVDPAQKVATPMHAPVPPVDLGPQRPPVDVTDVIVPVPEPIPYVVPQPTPQPGIAAKPAFDPVGARPKGNPANWVTVNDYRSSWINREMTGTARFRLEVGASGRVESCAITVSSGHPELDKATCALVAQRARFEPARDASGAAVAGSYANAVRWELPE